MPSADVEEYASEIAERLSEGELDDAFERFGEWARREARYAAQGYAANIGPLVETMMQMIGWMYPRVPREAVRSAARAAALAA